MLLVHTGLTTASDASGRYGLRAVDAGVHTLVVQRLGFLPVETTVAVHNGRDTRLDVALEAVVLPLGAVTGTGAAAPAGAVRLERAAIVASGARTAGDLLAGLPGVVLAERGPGGGRTVSLRGGAADAVLVLVDGVPLNDALGGEADLSTVPAASLASVTVLPGARSARYGPRAAAGVVLVETRGAGGERSLTAGAGALGERSGAAAWGAPALGGLEVAWSAGASWRTLDGAFEHTREAALGGGTHTRTNADAATADAWLALRTDVAGAPLHLRGGWTATERGLPGQEFAPSPAARQESGRLQASAAWRRAGDASAVAVHAAAARQRVRSHDPAPRLGLPYDDSAAVTSLDVRLAAERKSVSCNFAAPPARALCLELGTGLDLRPQWFRTSALVDAPGRRVDAGVFAHAALTSRRDGPAPHAQPGRPARPRSHPGRCGAHPRPHAHRRRRPAHRARRAPQRLQSARAGRPVLPGRCGGGSQPGAGRGAGAC